MRTICDMCEGAPAALFCATHKAALCPSCDDKVHVCNRLASRHVLVRLGEPSEVPHRDICENSPAFLFCKTDGSSLCLQCDAIVHVGGSKQTHERYVLLKQRVECIEKVGPSEDLSSQCMEQNGITHQTLSFGNIDEKLDGNKVSPVTISELHINLDEHNSAKIDLNVIPRRIKGDVTNSRQFAAWLSLMDISRESTPIV
eukprot:TRINITY_DN6901_c1_g1_i9.p1 TRINITY_DN6901_c1_g1~~TRINITY_DN6901_c1_g1_i9.p1  ORF type:complete len:200 (-),score=22.24 TRINITY_DN6901_c1_g1_i9:262-861(-)